MSKRGFSPIIVVLAVSLLALIPVLNSQTTARFSGPAVKGELIARGGDDSGSGSSGGDSGGSHDSGGSSGGSSGSSGGSSGSTNTPTAPQIEKPEKVKRPEKVEIKQKKPEIENEVENEVEKPEVDRVEIKSSASGELEVETKVASGSAVGRNRKGKTSQFTLNIATQSGQSQIEIKAENGEIQFEFQGVGALTNFPLTFDKATNTLIVNTPNGPKPIRVLPNQASETAKTAGVENLVEKIELVEAATGSAEPVVFKVSGKRTGNLLGLLPVSADVETQVGAQTGQILTTTEPLWLRIFGSLVR